MSFQPNLLAKTTSNATDILREDLEDTLKRYSELDLLVEILQNALDSLDYRRYVTICKAAALDPSTPETINAWNKAVTESIDRDYREYAAASTAADRASLYKRWTDEDQRRAAWWTELGTALGATPTTLSDAADSYRPKLIITVRSGSPAWAEVEDNGLGMPDIPDCFRHKSSTKRTRANESRRLGTRGSHGWGLSAVLGMSDNVEVMSRIPDTAAKAYRFESYASFVSAKIAQPQNDLIDVNSPDGQFFSERLRIAPSEMGTHVRVRLADIGDGTLLGYTLSNYSPDLFENLLRLYTPVGQVNDYVLHPAFHCLRAKDLTVTVRSILPSASEDVRQIKFDFLRLDGLPGINQVRYDNYVNVNTGWPSNVSVHTVHRTKIGSYVYLSAAEIQGAELVTHAEDILNNRKHLPAYINDSGVKMAQIPRGFQLALSGGMRSEYVARPPTGNTAMLRGVVLAEQERPTLGRKHVMDQRQAIPRVARDHQNEYEYERLKVRPQAVPPVATPAQAKWRREFFDGVIMDTDQTAPLSADLYTWATSKSREARTMLVFGELLQRKAFGDLRVLRVHLQDRYDFAFLLTSTIGTDTVPGVAEASRLNQAGYADLDRKTNQLSMYGIGEFKADGEDIFSDFDPKDPRKSPDTLDLLVCWDFEEAQVEARSWSVEDATLLNSQIPGQTHVWLPGGEEFVRSRPLAVVSLKKLMEGLRDAGELLAPPAPWPGTLPKNYL